MTRLGLKILKFTKNYVKKHELPPTFVEIMEAVETKSRCAVQYAVDRLEEDHESAQILAKKLSNIKNLFVDLNLVKTNIIFIYLKHNKLSDEEFLFQLKENNIKIDYKGNRKFRLVTHNDFKKNEINTVVSTISNILKGQNVKKCYSKK